MEKIEIECKDLSKSFSGKNIFKNLSFSVSSGKSVSVTGKNGSGKSTLIKILANLIQPNSGSISIKSDETEIPLENRYLRTGLLSPYLSLYDELTGWENLEFYYSLKSKKRNDIKDKLKFYLDRVGLFERRNDLLKNYSSGMKQRLKLAFSVMNEPEILLLDEPRSNLDKAGTQIVEEIAAEQKNKGILFIATNDEDDKLLCDETINIENF